MELLVLDANLRDGSVKASAVRKQGFVPGVCYGKGFESKPVKIEYQSFRKLFREVGSSQVFNLNIDGETVPVLIQEIDYHPLTDQFDHVDFMQVNMKVKVDATVPIEVVGQSPAIKNFNAVISTAKQEIEVRCLPMDIPREILVDVSGLENIGDSISVADLKIDDSVEVLEDPEDTVLSITAVEEYKEIEAEVPDELKEEEATAAEGEKDGSEDKKDDEDGEDKKSDE